MTNSNYTQTKNNFNYLFNGKYPTKTLNTGFSNSNENISLNSIKSTYSIDKLKKVKNFVDKSQNQVSTGKNAKIYKSEKNNFCQKKIPFNKNLYAFFNALNTQTSELYTDTMKKIFSSLPTKKPGTKPEINGQEQAKKLHFECNTILKIDKNNKRFYDFEADKFKLIREQFNTDDKTEIKLVKIRPELSNYYLLPIADSNDLIGVNYQFTNLIRQVSNCNKVLNDMNIYDEQATYIGRKRSLITTKEQELLLFILSFIDFQKKSNDTITINKYDFIEQFKLNNFTFARNEQHKILADIFEMLNVLLNIEIWIDCLKYGSLKPMGSIEKQHLFNGITYDEMSGNFYIYLNKTFFDRYIDTNYRSRDLKGTVKKGNIPYEWFDFSYRKISNTEKLTTDKKTTKTYKTRNSILFNVYFELTKIRSLEKKELEYSNITVEELAKRIYPYKQKQSNDKERYIKPIAKVINQLCEAGLIQLKAPINDYETLKKKALFKIEVKAYRTVETRNKESIISQKIKAEAEKISNYAPPEILQDTRLIQSVQHFEDEQDRDFTSHIYRSFKPVQTSGITLLELIFFNKEKFKNIFKNSLDLKLYDRETETETETLLKRAIALIE